MIAIDIAERPVQEFTVIEPTTTTDDYPCLLASVIVQLLQEWLTLHVHDRNTKRI